METEPVPRTTVEVLGLLESALAAIDHGQRRGLSHEQRLGLMRRARRVAERVRALAAVLTGEAERSGSATAVAGTGMTSLIAAEEHLDTRLATGEVFEARDLARHHQLADAALAGRLSVAHARGIARGMGHLPRTLNTTHRDAAEAEFLRHAATSTPHELEARAGQVLAAVAPELVPTACGTERALAEQRARAMKRRSLRWGDAGDGATWFTALLPHLEAEALITAVEARVALTRRQERDQAKATQAGHRRPAPGQPSRGATPEQRRADALTAAVSDPEHARGGSTFSGAVPRVIVTIAEADLHAHALRAGIMASGNKIPAGVLRRMLCDATILPIVLGSDSQILDLGHEQRLAPPSLRRALEFRDKGCIFPGCTATFPECEAHHIVPWWDNGPTSLGNLCLLCPHHHGLIEPDRAPPDPARRWHICFDPRTRAPVALPPRRLADGYLTVGACGASARGG